MQSSDIAGILGLLIGGAGGYYGGQKRADRQKEMLEMLYGNKDEDQEETAEILQSNIRPSAYETEMGDILNEAHPGREVGASPMAAALDNIDLLKDIDYTRGSFEKNDGTLGYTGYPTGTLVDDISNKLFPRQEGNNGGLFRNKEGDLKPGSSGFLAEMLFELQNAGIGLGDILAQSQGYTGLFNEGGRVGLANGGNPYAGLGYSPVNNIFRMDGINTGTVAPGASSGFQSFQDGLTELDVPETSLLPDPMQTPMPINTIGSGLGGDGAANYQRIMGRNVFGDEVGSQNNPLGFGPQAAYGTDFDGTDLPEGKYRDFTGEIKDLDEAGLGPNFMNSLSNALSNIPNITNAYGLFDYFSKENKDARKAEEKTRQEAMQLAREQEAQTLAELALQQEEERNLPDVFNPTPNIAAITTAPVSITTAQTPASVAAYNAANAGIGRAMTPTGDIYSTQTYSAAQRKANSRRAGKDKMGRSRGIGGGGAADRAAGRSAGNTGKSAGMGEGGSRHCFEPNTLIQMADGTEKKIKHIILGDNTKGGEVTGVLQFKPTDEIHEYKGVTVAGSHFVKENGKFIPVADSPHSVKIDIIPVVYSLDTSDRRIWIKDIEFADYNGDGIAKDFLANAGVDLTGFNKEVLRQVEHRLI